MLERQLSSAVELIDTLELQSAEGVLGPGVRGRLNRLVESAQAAPSAERLRLCSQLAAAQAETQRLAIELGAVAERERTAREASEREHRRSTAVLRSSLESAAHARSTMELQQGVVLEARAAHAEELHRTADRLAASELLRAKAESGAKAKDENVKRLMDLVQQHERRRADDRERSEKSDLERLHMQRGESARAPQLTSHSPLRFSDSDCSWWAALAEMADQLDLLKAQADADTAVKQAAAERLAAATLP